MADKKPQKDTQTKHITNFTGRLTRMVNGDMDSGFAKFTMSYGYNAFNKPMNLTWLESPNDVSPGGITDLVLDGKVRFIGENGNSFAYLIGSKGTLYKVQINSASNNSVNSVVGRYSVLAGGATYNKGGSMEFFGSNEKIYIGSDSQVNSVNFDGSADVVVGNAANYASNVFRPMTEFSGTLVFGNANTIGQIGATGTVISSVIGISSTVGNVYSALNPPLPPSMLVKDIDNSPDNNYILMAASEVDYENISQGGTPNMLNTVPAQSKVFYWNGSDKGATAATTLATNLLTALQSYLQQNHLFAADSFGAGLFQESKKIVTLNLNKSPFPNATGVNGQFLFWSVPERVTLGSTQRLTHAMYYFGSLDQENPPGLFRVLREFPPLFLGNTVETPFNQLVGVQYSDANASQSSVVTAGVGTHYYSFRGVASGNQTSVLGLRYLNIPGTGLNTPQLGVYETQNQLFSKRISVAQIRVYTEPTIAGNGFQIDIIGGDGAIVENGTFTYSFGSVVDPNTNSSVMERINFNPNIQTLFSLGIRITNTGSTNMTIKKIEIDYDESGK